MRYGLSLEIRGQLGTAAWHFHPGALCLVLVALEEARREKSGSNPVWPDLCLLPALHGLRCREDDGLAGICLPAAGAGVGRCHHHARRRRLQRHAGCRRHGDALRKPCEPPLDGRAPAASARRADPAVGRPGLRGHGRGGEDRQARAHEPRRAGGEDTDGDEEHQHESECPLLS